MNTHELAEVCPLPNYTESSARMKLARHRGRGEMGWTMFACPWVDHWHVIDGTLDEALNAWVEGTNG